MTEDINILTFDNFIQKIKTIKTYRSNANKESNFRNTII